MTTRGYLLVLMGGLLAQGLGSALFRAVPALAAASPLVVRGLLGIDGWHALIHILWGAAGVVIVLRSRSSATPARLAVVFGVFYTLFGVLGVLVHHPLGLELDALENGFHLIAGPLTLVIGVLALRAGARTTGTARPSG